MKIEILIAATLVIAASGAAQAKAKPKPQTPPPTISGSCKLDRGIWHGHCQIAPPIKIPKTGKQEKSK